MATLSISLAHAPVTDRPGLAKMADDAGMKTIWVEDGDAFVTLAYLSHHVRRARLGTGVARAFARSAMVTGCASANMQQITDGRFVLGLGSGTKGQNVQQIGQEFDHPATRIAELCELLRAMWGNKPGQPLKFSGRFYDVQFDGPTLDRIRCAGKPPPIYLAAVNDMMLRTAGRTCNGLAGHPCFSAAYLKDVVQPKIQQGLDDRQRDRASFELSSWVITSIDPDVGLARRRAAYQLGFYFSTKSYGNILAWHGFPDIQSRIRTALFEHRDWEEVADCIPEDMIDLFSVTGTPNQCVDKIGRYQGILDDIVLYSHAAGPARAYAADNLRHILRTFG
jgi:probable F420-dependent oxidoreductase